MGKMWYCPWRGLPRGLLLLAVSLSASAPEAGGPDRVDRFRKEATTASFFSAASTSSASGSVVDRMWRLRRGRW